jgi:large repetitive protein
MAEKQGLLSRTAGRLVLALIVALAALVLGPASAALAQAPQLTIDFPEGSPTNNPTPQLRGTTNDSLDEVSVVIERVGGGGGTLFIAPTGEEWSVSPAAGLPDGNYTARAFQTNAEGEGQSGSVGFTVDTTKPTVSLAAPAALSKNTKPVFSGSSSDSTSVVVRIYNSSQSEVTSATGGGGGSWTAGGESNLSDGTYTARAEQTDQAGNTGVSNTVTFTVDTTAPSPQITAPANGAFVKTETPTISGTAGSAAGDSSSVTLRITPSSGPAQEIAVSRNGSTWSYTPGPLSNGSYQAQAEQSDQAGNTGASNTVTFTVKTQGPAVTLTALPPATNNPAPGFSGTAGVAPGDVPKVTVKVYAGSAASGTPVQTLTASIPLGSASWSAQAAHLPDGTYTVQAEQSDEAGTPSKTSSSTFTVDTVLPLVSLVPGNTEKHTATPKFEGNAGTAAGDLPTVTLNIYKGPSATGTPVRVTSVVAKSGKWSAVPSAALQNGTYTAQAEQADQAGNHGLSLPASTFTISSGGPVVTLTPIASQTNNASPSFSGSVGLANGKVKLQVYPGSHASGNAPVREATITATGSTWSVGPVAALHDGTYTAIAEESDSLGDIGVSNEATFTVDSVAPAISLTSPANGSSASGASQVVEGSAGTAPGDAAAVTVRLAAGTSIGGQILQTRVAPNEGGHWRVNFEGLAPGSYTTQAEQSDAAGNSALSQAATFTLTPAAVSSANPTAAFTWVPSAPRVGQTVSLVSSSSAATSPIIGYAWDVAGTNAFLAGASVRSTVFSTSGNHVVHLSVSAADGRSSVATATIPVLPATYALMRPFPIVHIASSETRSGIRLRLLSVRAPSGSRISVTCHNRGCPVKSQQKVAAAAATGVAGYTFRKFERALRAGVVLEIRVSAPNSIGKYTRLTIRKGRLPQRLDQCLTPGGAKTMACPS